MHRWHIPLGRCPQRTATKQILGFVQLMYALTRIFRFPRYVTSGFQRGEAKPGLWQKSALFQRLTAYSLYFVCWRFLKMCLFYAILLNLSARVDGVINALKLNEID